MAVAGMEGVIVRLSMPPCFAFAEPERHLSHYRL